MKRFLSVLWCLVVFSLPVFSQQESEMIRKLKLANYEVTKKVHTPHLETSIERYEQLHDEFLKDFKPYLTNLHERDFFISQILNLTDRKGRIEVLDFVHLVLESQDRKHQFFSGENKFINEIETIGKEIFEILPTFEEYEDAMIKFSAEESLEVLIEAEEKLLIYLNGLPETVSKDKLDRKLKIVTFEPQLEKRKKELKEAIDDFYKSIKYDYLVKNTNDSSSHYQKLKNIQEKIENYVFEEVSKYFQLNYLRKSRIRLGSLSEFIWELDISQLEINPLFQKCYNVQKDFARIFEGKPTDIKENDPLQGFQIAEDIMIVDLNLEEIKHYLKIY